jgi:NADPH:quinone reductase
LPPPWEPALTKTPLVVYGASTAVGAFAIKLARRSNVHPIIAIAGSGRDMVETLLDPTKGDTVVDYREGHDHIVAKTRELLQAQGLEPASPSLALDTISEKGSPELMTRMLTHDHGHASFVLLEKDYSAVAARLQTSLTYVGYVHTGPFPTNPERGIKYNPGGHGHDFGVVYASLFTRGLQQGWLTPHPHQLISKGLNGLPTALRNLRDGKASAVKYVVRVADTAEP